MDTVLESSHFFRFLEWSHDYFWAILQNDLLTFWPPIWPSANHFIYGSNPVLWSGEPKEHFGTNEIWSPGGGSSTLPVDRTITKGVYYVYVKPNDHMIKENDTSNINTSHNNTAKMNKSKE